MDFAVLTSLVGMSLKIYVLVDRIREKTRRRKNTPARVGGAPSRRPRKQKRRQ